jgi:hypothetical protein
VADIVRYHGCIIIVHSDTTMDGRLVGSYEIIPDQPETVTAFAERDITRLHSIVESCDRSGSNPPLTDREYLVEMAKCEIDFVLEEPF